LPTLIGHPDPIGHDQIDASPLQGDFPRLGAGKGSRFYGDPLRFIEFLLLNKGKLPNERAESQHADFDLSIDGFGTNVTGSDQGEENRADDSHTHD
jgi:hypothetical protein